MALKNLGGTKGGILGHLTPEATVRFELGDERDFIPLSFNKLFFTGRITSSQLTVNGSFSILNWG